MDIVNVYEAKTNLSKLIDRAAAGEDVIIGRNGKPVARITRLLPERPPIRFGLLRAKVRIAPDFDAPLPDRTLAEFEGR